MRILVGINRVCYGTCLLAIISGAFLAVFAIWTEQQDVGWKGVATAAVLVFAAVLVLATNGIIGSKVMEEGGGVSDFAPPTPGRPMAAGAGGPSPLASRLAETRREHIERAEESEADDERS
jgi:hypothetical protein